MTGHKQPSQETRLIFKGTVQGVFFRATAKQIADQLGIKRYARNMSDGSVEVGITSGDVNAFITEMKKAPPPIEITSVEKTTRPLSEAYTSFEIG